MIKNIADLAIYEKKFPCYGKSMKRGSTIAVLIPEAQLKQLFQPADLSILESLGDCRFNETGEHLDESAAIDLLRNATIAVGSWGTVGPNERILRACPQLCLWEHVAGSVKRFFGQHHDGRELVIASCAPAIADSVAEMTIGLLIFGLRRLFEKNHRMLGGSALPDAPKVNLFSSRIGVIGASQVGRRVVRFLRHFGAEVLLHDPYLDKREAHDMGARLVPDLVELFRESHAVTLHTPALPETAKLVGARHFAAMPDHAVFVNTSRGSCVDEAALAKALHQRPLFAFLDVVERGSDSPESPLAALPNCFLTPHTAGGPNFRMGEQAVADIKAFLCGGEPQMAVTPSQLPRLA